MSIWTALEERLDPGLWRPRLAEGIETARFEVSGGAPYVMAANLRDLVHYRLSVEEAALLPLLDGARSLNEIAVARLADGAALDAAGTVALARLLHRGGFLDTPFVDVDAALEHALHPLTLRRRAGRFLRTLSVEWFGAERLVRFLYRYVLRHLFNKIGLIFAALIVASGVAAFVEATSHHHYSIQNRQFGVVFVVFMLLDITIIAIHELGHATVLVHYGRRVKSAGFRIYFGSPSFFIESSDGLMLSRERRMAQAAAGAGFEVVGTSIGAIALWLHPDGAAGHILYQFVIINYFVLFLNLVPFLELDGYWILSDALRMPDLRPDSLAFVRRELWQRLATRTPLTRRETWLAVFGITGVIATLAAFVSAWYFWRRVFGDTLLTMWHGGVVGKILLLILLSFVLGPVIRAVLVALRSLFQAVRALVHRVWFRAQGRWRIEAAELLDASGVFGDVPVETLNDLAGRVSVRTVPRGAIVFGEGSVADAYYLVRAGVFEVVEDGSTRVLRQLGRGSGFGEYGLLESAPRTATVRAATRGELFVLDKGAFERLLATRTTTPGYELSAQQVSELAALAPFAHLADAELRILAEQGSWISVAPGEDIITQGEPGDAFYVIGTGRLTIIENGIEKRTCAAGEHVGEIALLADSARTATVRAATPARLFRLDRAGFASFVAAGFRSGALPTYASGGGVHTESSITSQGHIH